MYECTVKDRKGADPNMTLEELLEYFSHSETIGENKEAVDMMRHYSREAQKITMKINTQYHEPEEMVELFSELTGKELDESFSLFPPFYTDFGKNITLGKNVFINAGCHFQDNGGIEIGDGTMIGPRTIIVTLNHDLDPKTRLTATPKSVKIGKNVWIGANCTILPGMSIGDNSVIGAGSVVVKSIESNTVAVGNPAQVIKHLEENSPFQ